MSSPSTDKVSNGASAFHLGPPARHEKQGDFYDAFDLTLEPVRERRAMVAELWARKRAKADLVVGSVNTHGETLCGDNLALTPEEVVEVEDATIYKPDLLAAIEAAGPDEDDEEEDDDASTAAAKDGGKKSGKEPYGSGPYADVGYQPDGKKRYPIDTEKHVRAAHSYISQKKNAAKYSSEQLAKIKARIAAAWRKLIDPKGPPSDQG